MSENCKEAVLATLQTDAWITSLDAAIAIGVGKTTVQRTLNRAHSNGLVERRERQNDSGRRIVEFRRLEEGEVPSLFPELPGLSIRPLAECFGGYTIYKKRPASAHRGSESWQA